MWGFERLCKVILYLCSYFSIMKKKDKETKTKTKKNKKTNQPLGDGIDLFFGGCARAWLLNYWRAGWARGGGGEEGQVASSFFFYSECVSVITKSSENTGHESNTAEPKAGNWPSSTSHFSPFCCCLSFVFVAQWRELLPKFLCCVLSQYIAILEHFLCLDQVKSGMKRTFLELHRLICL